MTKATVESFVRFYNRVHGSQYELADHHASSARCFDKDARTTLNLEICILEGPSSASWRGMGSRPGGRSAVDARRMPSVAAERIIEGLRNALITPVRANTALVVRQVVATWNRQEWARHLVQIPWSRIGFRVDTFDRGIWIVCGKKLSATLFGKAIGEGVDFIRVDPYRTDERQP